MAAVLGVRRCVAGCGGRMGRRSGVRRWTLIDLAGHQAGRGQTGPDGWYFEIPAPGQGTYTLIAMAGAHQPHAAAVPGRHRPGRPAGAADQHHTLTGTIRAASSGTAVTTATVTLADARGDVLAARRTDKDGRYAFDEIVPGSYTLAVAAPSYQPAAPGGHRRGGYRHHDRRRRPAGGGRPDRHRADGRRRSGGRCPGDAAGS